MAWQDENNQDRAEICQGFDGVHRHARPRTGIDVPVMHRMDMFVDRGLMQNEMHDVKVETLPQGKQRKQQNEPDGMRAKRQGSDQSVGVGPAQETLQN